MIGAMLKNRNGTAEARGQRAVIRDQWSVIGEGRGSGGGRGGRGCAPEGRDGGAGVSAQGRRRGRYGRTGVRQRAQGAARSPGATQKRRPGGAGVCGTSTNPSEHWVRVPVQPAAGTNMGLKSEVQSLKSEVQSLKPGVNGRRARFQYICLSHLALFGVVSWQVHFSVRRIPHSTAQRRAQDCVPTHRKAGFRKPEGFSSGHKGDN